MGLTDPCYFKLNRLNLLNARWHTQWLDWKTPDHKTDWMAVNNLLNITCFLKDKEQVWLTCVFYGT